MLTCSSRSRCISTQLKLYELYFHSTSFIKSWVFLMVIFLQIASYFFFRKCPNPLLDLHKYLSEENYFFINSVVKRLEMDQIKGPPDVKQISNICLNIHHDIKQSNYTHK